ILQLSKSSIYSTKPKKTCLAQYTQHELDLVVAQLNNRPRKTLKFKIPKEIIERGVALTD
ncbi:TPA: IS30 family transposase, partial [Escherichia coli]|nr:IS30 family transposase [Shigella sonnei]HBD0042456.1 IS30 family transposase [Escherichia coli]HCR3027674.1 IS30 family transposase [Escherichia coli]HCR3071401.1 IS30 family transposase [Escherichia coli]HCR3159398.1 IS30 family transposase [Escherichia coli]